MTVYKLTIFVVSEGKHQLVSNLYMAMGSVMTEMSRKRLTSAYCAALKPFFVGAVENP